MVEVKICHWVVPFKEEIRCLTARRRYLASVPGRGSCCVQPAGAGRRCCSGNICPGPACALPHLPVCHGVMAPDSDRIFLESWRKLVCAQAIASTGNKPIVCAGSVRKASSLNDHEGNHRLVWRCSYHGWQLEHCYLYGSSDVKEALRLVQRVGVRCPTLADGALCSCVL